MISWLSSGDGWGTREEAIPGEWAMLVLIMVLGAVLGLLVLWFTAARHERTVRRRARRRTGLGAGTRPTGMTLGGIGAAADEKGAEVAQAEPPAAAEVADADDEKVADESPAADEDSPEQVPPAKGRRKLTDEILSRVESELAGRAAPRWKELAALVHEEFGVTVHPSSIQKAVKRRRLATESPLPGRGAEPATATA